MIGAAAAAIFEGGSEGLLPVTLMRWLSSSPAEDSAGASMRACQWALLLPPLAGLLLLMAYPVPHKYNAGGTFPQTATVLGFTIGMTTGSANPKTKA